MSLCLLTLLLLQRNPVLLADYQLPNDFQLFTNGFELFAVMSLLTPCIYHHLLCAILGPFQWVRSYQSGPTDMFLLLFSGCQHTDDRFLVAKPIGLFSFDTRYYVSYLILLGSWESFSRLINIFFCAVTKNLISNDQHKLEKTAQTHSHLSKRVYWPRHLAIFLHSSSRVRSICE